MKLRFRTFDGRTVDAMSGTEECRKMLRSKVWCSVREVGAKQPINNPPVVLKVVKVEPVKRGRYAEQNSERNTERNGWHGGSNRKRTTERTAEGLGYGGYRNGQRGAGGRMGRKPGAA